MRSVNRWYGAVSSAAFGAAGGCAHGGSSGLPVTDSGYAFAGDGPSCQPGNRLPGATDAWIMATPGTAPPGPRAAAEDGCMNAVMTVIAYEVDRPIRQWRGEVYWTGTISDGGDEYFTSAGGDAAANTVIGRDFLEGLLGNPANVIRPGMHPVHGAVFSVRQASGVGAMFTTEGRFIQLLEGFTPR